MKYIARLPCHLLLKHFFFDSIYFTHFRGDAWFEKKAVALLTLHFVLPVQVHMLLDYDNVYPMYLH